MAVITLKPKDVVIPFDIAVMLGRKLKPKVEPARKEEKKDAENADHS